MNSPATGTINMRHDRPHHDRGNAALSELARAEQDYQMLRLAYVELTQQEPANEVALSMVGADMNRAQAALQLLAGEQLLPLAQDISCAIRAPSRRLADVAS